VNSKRRRCEQKLRWLTACLVVLHTDVETAAPGLDPRFFDAVYVGNSVTTNPSMEIVLDIIRHYRSCPKRVLHLLRGPIRNKDFQDFYKKGL